MVEKARNPIPKAKSKQTATGKQRTLLDMFAKPSAKFTGEIGEAETLDTHAQPGPSQQPEAGSSFVGSQDTTPIIIEETPPPHSAPPTDASSPISLCDGDEAPDGSSPSAPILVDSSPIKAPAFNLGNRSFHPFFTFTAPLKHSLPAPKLSTPKTWVLPYPDRDSQHVRGPQATLPPSKPYLHSRSLVSTPPLFDASPSSYSFLSSRIEDSHQERTLEISSVAQPSPLPISSFIDTIPRQHVALHPSIPQVIDRVHSNADFLHSKWEAWTDKWRPRAANEVLGNEASAQYLRSWLLALKLQAEGPEPPSVNDRSVKTTTTATTTKRNVGKRSRVITEVARGRARKRAKTESDESDDWIAYSDEEEEEEMADVLVSSATEAVGLDSFSSQFHAIPTPPHEAIQEFGELHNTILLSGPPGTGKTASVYACAEELGWQVFEVYPGIGKRNGSNLEYLVGEVGKNHLVRQRPQGNPDFFTLGSPSKRRTTLNRHSKLGRTGGGTGGETDEATKGSNPQNVDDDQFHAFGQSLILLEEVDILFKEDSNFWPTVIKIIKECRRPVICTCNDPGLLPLLDLPLQKVLEYQPCSSDVTVSYLQSLCYGEGQPISRSSLERLLGSRRSDLHEEPGTGGREPVDLRHAINLLQLTMCTSRTPLNSAALSPQELAVPDVFKEDHPRRLPADDVLAGVDNDKWKSLAYWKAAAHEAETRSFLDSQLSRSFSGVPSDEQTSTPSDDNEMGYTILYDTRTQSSLPVTYSCDAQIRLMVKECLPLLQVKDEDTTVLMENMELDTELMLEKANMFKTHLGHVLREVCPQRVWKMSLPNLSMDYGPYIKQIAEADDAEAEATIQRVQVRGGRKTRNSAMTGYVRTLRLSDLGRRSIYSLCFEE